MNKKLTKPHVILNLFQDLRGILNRVPNDFTDAKFQTNLFFKTTNPVSLLSSAQRLRAQLNAFITSICIITTNAGYCAANVLNEVSPMKQSLNQAANLAHSPIFKFIIAMGGVLLSSIIIFSGLKIYKKLTSKTKGYENLKSNDNLSTPKNIDDAVTFFIKRNKLC